MAIKTQGTELWFLDPTTHHPVKADCILNLDGLGGSRGQIEVSCLEDDEDSYVSGRKTPGTASAEINFDPAIPSHVRMNELYDAGTVLEWALGWHDGTADADYDSSGFDLDTSRTWLTFQGYISDFPFNFAKNDVVKTTMTIQLSGARVLLPKA